MNLSFLSKIESFDWDDGNLHHIKKHDVTYEECESIFYNTAVFFEDTKHSIHEKRFLAYGITSEAKYLTLVFTVRNSKIRVISARAQNKKERAVYNEYCKSQRA